MLLAERAQHRQIARVAACLQRRLHFAGDDPLRPHVERGIEIVGPLEAHRAVAQDVEAAGADFLLIAANTSLGVTLLLELVRAYGVLATGGDLSNSRMLLGRARIGDTLHAVNATTATRVADPAAAYLVTSALQGVIERGTGRALSAQGHEGAIAGKTGTSNNGRDAWFIAYSPTLVVGVWVGYDDARDLHMTGANAALTALASSGLPTDQFTFAGFLPSNSGSWYRTSLAFERLPVPYRRVVLL